MATPSALNRAPQLPFKYVGGDASVDLVNTVDWTSRGLVDDRLSDYDRLTRWAEGAGVISAREGAALRALAVAQPRAAQQAHRAALELRWLLRQLYVRRAAGERPDGPELDALNETVRRAFGELELAPSARGSGATAPLVWRWRRATERPESLLWPVVRAAAELLASDESAHLRECGGEDCGWMFVDRSRNGLRRWCQMETCGNREKARRRARA